MFSSQRTPLKSKRKKINLNLHKIDGLHEPGGSSEGACVEDPTSGGNDLATAPVDGVGVQGHIVDVEANSAHIFVSKNTL